VGGTQLYQAQKTFDALNAHAIRAYPKNQQKRHWAFIRSFTKKPSQNPLNHPETWVKHLAKMEGAAMAKVAIGTSINR